MDLKMQPFDRARVDPERADGSDEEWDDVMPARADLRGMQQQSDADAQLAASLQRDEEEAADREQAIAMQEVASRAQGGGSSSDPASAAALTVIDENMGDAEVEASEGVDVGEGDRDEQAAVVKRLKKDAPQLRDVTQWAQNRDAQSKEQLRVFHTVEGIGSQDMANQADFILTSMYGFVSARYDWAHPEEEGKSYFSGFYESFAGATLWVCLALQIALFMDPSTDGYETSSRKAAKMWTLDNLHARMMRAAKGERFTNMQVGEGEEEDMARTCIGASQKRGGGARGGGVTGLGRKLHESSANLHRRRGRVDDLCKGKKLEQQIECFRHVYDRIRCLVPNCTHLPMLPPPILLQQPPSFFVPANAAFRVEESSGEDEDDYARQIAEGKIAHKAKKAAMGIGDKDKQGAAAARETVVIQKREKAPVRKAMKAKEAAAAAKEARHEREADNAWREEGDDDEEEGAKIDKLDFRTFGWLSEQREHDLGLVIVQAAQRQRQQRVETAAAVKEAVDWLVEQTCVNLITEEIEQEYDEAAERQQKLTEEWDANRRLVHPKIHDEDGELDEAAYGALSERERKLYDMPRPRFDQLDHELRKRVALAKALPKPSPSKKQPALGRKPNAKKVRLEKVRKLEPGHFCDYAAVFGFESEAAGRAHIEDMHARRKIVHPDGREEMRGLDNPANNWAVWERRFLDLTDVKRQGRMIVDWRRWKKEMDEAIKAAKPKPSYEANPYWDSHKKQWKDGQEEVGMQREAANQQAKRAAADRTTQNAEQKRKRDEHKGLETQRKAAAKKARLEASAKAAEEKEALTAARKEELEAKRAARGVEAVTKKLTVVGAGKTLITRTATEVAPTAEALAARQLRADRKKAQKMVEEFNEKLGKSCKPGPPKDGSAVMLFEPVLDDEGRFKSYRSYTVWQKRAIDTWKGRNLIRKPYREGTRFKFKISGYSSPLTDWQPNPAPARADYEQTLYYYDQVTGQRVLDANGLPAARDLIVHPAGTPEAAAARALDGVEPEEPGPDAEVLPDASESDSVMGDESSVCGSESSGSVMGESVEEEEEEETDGDDGVDENHLFGDDDDGAFDFDFGEEEEDEEDEDEDEEGEDSAMSESGSAWDSDATTAPGD